MDTVICPRCGEQIPVGEAVPDQHHQEASDWKAQQEEEFAAEQERRRAELEESAEQELQERLKGVDTQVKELRELLLRMYKPEGGGGEVSTDMRDGVVRYMRTGFVDRVRSQLSCLSGLEAELSSEIAATESRWKERQAQIDALRQSVAHTIGELVAIGAPVPRLDEIELPSGPTVHALPDGQVALPLEEEVFSTIDGAPGPLAKREIMDLLPALTEARWNAVIKSLVDTGRVVRTGKKKGARYSTLLAPSMTPVQRSSMSLGPPTSDGWRGRRPGKMTTTSPR